jgi:hypothetical protein
MDEAERQVGLRVARWGPETFSFFLLWCSVHFSSIKEQFFVVGLCSNLYSKAFESGC